MQPLLDDLLIGMVKMEKLALGHQDESPHFLVIILDMRSLEPGVLNIQNSSLHRVVFAVKLNQLVADQYKVLLLEVGVRIFVAGHLLLCRGWSVLNLD